MVRSCSSFIITGTSGNEKMGVVLSACSATSDLIGSSFSLFLEVCVVQLPRANNKDNRSVDISSFDFIAKRKMTLFIGYKEQTYKKNCRFVIRYPL